MKKLLLLTVLLIPFLCFSQSEHLKFRDIEINGTATQFLSKLKNLGYIVKDVDSDGYTMKGKFAGDDCTLYIYSSPKTKTVYKIVVVFSEKSSWHSLKNQYNSIKEQLTNKYKNPTQNNCFFKSPYYDGDGYEMQAVKNNKCLWLTQWNLESGEISLAIYSTCSVIIQYEDKINMQKKAKEDEEIRQEKNKKMQNDL